MRSVMSAGESLGAQLYEWAQGALGIRLVDVDRRTDVQSAAATELPTLRTALDDDEEDARLLCLLCIVHRRLRGPLAR